MRSRVRNICWKNVLSLHLSHQYTTFYFFNIYIFFILGCDTTSAFYRKGKVSAWKIAKAKEEYVQTFYNLGTETTPSAEPTKQLHHFVCHLYGFEGYSDINRVRFEIFKGGKFDEQLLPPNEDSLDQHISRANFQCYIWRRSTQPILNLPSFCHHGWKIDTVGNDLINWMTLPEKRMRN